MRQIRGNTSTACAMKREVRTGCDGGYVTTRDVQLHGVIAACFCWEVSVPGG
jgi:hypothetical protein